MMKRPLIIAPFFGHFSAAGIVERHFVEALASPECRPTVLCVKYDNMHLTENKYAEIIATKELKAVIFGEKVLRNLKLGQWTLTPDYMRYSWNVKARHVIRRLLKSEHYDYVLTVSFPCSCHALGLMVKQETGIPWVAQFYDPWLNNPIRKITSQRLMRYDADGERRVAMNADLILHTNHRMVLDWLVRYGEVIKPKTFRLPIINPATPNEKKEGRTGIFTMAHIGSLYSGRTAKPFLDALRKVKERRPGLLEKFHINFVGPNVRGDIQRTTEYGLDNVVTWTGRVSETACVEYYQSADMFLAIDTSYDFNLFYPSKILKYFSFQKPILGLVSGETVLKEEMEQSHNWSIGMDDTEGIATFLIKVLDGNTDLSVFDSAYWENYTPERVIDRFNSYVNAINNDKDKK